MLKIDMIKKIDMIITRDICILTHCNNKIEGDQSKKIYKNLL